MALEVAPDFVDKSTVTGKVIWILRAVSRFATAIFVAILFFIGLAVLELRTQAENALTVTPAGDETQQAAQVQQNQAVLATFHGYLSNMLRDPGAAATTVGQARTFAVANQSYVISQRDLQIQRDRVAREELRVKSAAEQAGCGQSPTLAAARACTPAAGVPADVATALSDAKQSYQTAVDAALAAERDMHAREVTYLDAGSSENGGAVLSPAAGALQDFDQLQTDIGAPWTSLLRFIFATDPMVSGTILSFLGGLLGSACLLFILITFPNYLPLTFGSGNDFFLRMFMGGAVAVGVAVAIRLGVAIPVTEVDQAKQAATALSLSYAAQQGLMGVASGFLAEQIAKWAKDYAMATFHGVRAAPAGDPPAEGAGGGLLSPGAAAELSGR